MIPPQEYILLENVEGYTVDHLLAAILDGHIDAYVEWPEGRRHVPMDYKGEVSRYARIMRPVFKDGDDKLIFSQVAVFSKEGEMIAKPKLCFTVSFNDIRVRASDFVTGQPSQPSKANKIEEAKRIIESCGKSNMGVKDIVAAIDREIPGLSDYEIGSLFKKAEHEEYSTRRKRGQRLRGKCV